MKQESADLPHIQALLAKANLATEIVAVEVCAGGGNNRTYKLKTTAGDFAVKKYFKAEHDKRDRLFSEFSFINYAMQVAPAYVPKAYVKDEASGFALYEFVNGEPFKAKELCEYDLQQAIDFFCLVNDPAKRVQATNLPKASEAGFSIQDHLNSVGGRIKELTASIQQGANREAIEIIKAVNQRWQQFNDRKIASLSQAEIRAELENNERCISPSDFGFHNALKMAANAEQQAYSVKFIDFEYAGWDDPARMVNDFFSQLAVPVPRKYYDYFLQQTMAIFPNPKMLMQRARLLIEVYQIKWCCIALNVFLPSHLARRKFANPDLDISGLYAAQVAKAELILSTMEAV